MMLTAIIILSILVVTLGYTTYNLLRKNETQEDILSGYLDYLDKFSRVIEVTDKKLNELDNRGSFSSDDEIGFFFENVKKLQDILNEFNIRKV
jgi:hypothetical protein